MASTATSGRQQQQQQQISGVYAQVYYDKRRDSHIHSRQLHANSCCLSFIIFAHCTQTHAYIYMAIS